MDNYEGTMRVTEFKLNSFQSNCTVSLQKPFPMEVLFALRRRGMAQFLGEVLNLKELLSLFPLSSFFHRFRLIGGTFLLRLFAFKQYYIH